MQLPVSKVQALRGSCFKQLLSLSYSHTIVEDWGGRQQHRAERMPILANKITLLRLQKYIVPPIRGAQYHRTPQGAGRATEWLSSQCIPEIRERQKLRVS